MSTFFKDHLVKPGYLADTDIYEIQVRCVSTETLLEQEEFRDINLLVIDTEGYDYDILKNLNLETVKPKVILFEHGIYSQTMSRNQIDELTRTLNLNGYQVLLNNNDAVAVKSDFLLRSNLNT
jgi:hypothetical protein